MTPAPPPVDRAREQVFRDLLAQVHRPLHRYLARRCAAHDVDDALADVLLVLWRRLDDVPAEQPLPWCYGVARGVLANQRRGERRRLALLDRVLRLDPPPAAAPPPDDDGAPPEVGTALATLAEADRELLRLWAWEELGPTEIAVVLGTTPNAASIRLHRARGRLRRALEVTGTGERRTGTGRGKEVDR